MKKSAWLFSAIITMAAFFVLGASAQSPVASSLAGDWSGALGGGHSSLPLVLHIKAEAGGKLSATLDSPSQGAYGLPGSDVDLTGASFRFAVPSVHGTYTGTVSADGKTISGTWSQGTPMPLVLTMTATAAQAMQLKPSLIDGDWRGVLHAGDVSLRLVFHFHAVPGDKIDATLDSIDQGANGIHCANVQLKGQKLTLDVPQVHGTYTATLSADGEKLSGTWDQGSSLPLDLTREPKQTLLPAPAPASPPVALKDLKPALDKEFAPLIASWPEAGLVVGVFDHGEHKTFAYGTAKVNSIFEIGSITKTFTGLLLAQMVQQHVVTLTDPVRELLPSGTVSKPASGPEITLLDLATQHSGLPRLPSNLNATTMADPYANYTVKDLYAFLAKQGVGRPEKTGFLYSNLGFGLLGQALADKAGQPYATILREQITEPLGMKDTIVTLSAEQQARLIQGYRGAHDKARVWNLNAMAGAGALRSTVDDLLTYGEAYLHPETLKAASAGPGATLPAALRMAQQPQADAPGGQKIALAWLINSEADIDWHNGGTGGYSSLLMFEPKRDRVIVVLYNCQDMDPAKSQLIDRVADNLNALMDGKPVPPLAP